MRRVAFAIGVVLVMGCSVPDGEDMLDLDKAVASMDAISREILAKWALQSSIKEWLKKRPFNDEVLGFKCEKKKSDGTWEPDTISGYATELAITVDDVLGAILGMPMDYSEALKYLGDDGVEFLRKEGLTQDGIERRCKWFVFPNYQEDKVAAEATGRNEYKAGDYALASQWMTVRMISEALTASSTPPPLPGFAPGGALVNLLPIMCALDAGSWGCPDNPKYPGGSPDK